jgi:hypothetical protein
MQLTHHAYYVEGPLSAVEALRAELKPLWHRQYDAFGINDARELVQLVSLKNYQDAVFVLGVAGITSEAQQALLKLFEEPQRGTTFVLVVPHGMLLPTLRSRMLEYPTLLRGAEEGSDEAKKFLKAGAKERSAQIAAMLKDDEGVKERVRELLRGLEAALLPKIADKAVREGLQDIQKVRSYVGDRSPSLKMLLEHLALALPRL